jgi:hypothetical protein
MSKFLKLICAKREIYDTEHAMLYTETEKTMLVSLDRFEPGTSEYKAVVLTIQAYPSMQRSLLQISLGVSSVMGSLYTLFIFPAILL